MTIFERFGNWIYAKLSAIVTALTPLAKSIAKGGGQVLLDAAKAAVSNVDLADLSNEQKFAQAKASVIDVLKKEGIPLITNAINGAIENAVAELHADGK